MNEYPNLSKEELEALLGSLPHVEDHHALDPGASDRMNEQALQRFGAGLRALTAKVNELESTVKELRLQLLQQEREQERAVRESQRSAAGSGEDAHDDAASVSSEAATGAGSEVRLSRMERYGRKGRS